jgi:hypothetical protein
MGTEDQTAKYDGAATVNRSPATHDSEGRPRSPSPIEAGIPQSIMVGRLEVRVERLEADRWIARLALAVVLASVLVGALLVGLTAAAIAIR